MADEIILYGLAGFGAALVIFFFIKLIITKNVETIEMSGHLRSNLKKGESVQNQVQSMLKSGNSKQAVEILKSKGNLTEEQSEKIIGMLQKLGGGNTLEKSAKSDLISNIKILIKENKKIEAIKLIKDSGDMSLKDAKDIVDKIASGNSDNY